MGSLVVFICSLCMNDCMYYSFIYAESVRNFADNPDPSFWQFEVEPDTRFGFWKHGVIRFSWERPRGMLIVCTRNIALIPRLHTPAFFGTELLAQSLAA